MVAHSCSPSYSGGWGRRISWTRKVKVALNEIMPLHSNLGDTVRLRLKTTTTTKKKKRKKEIQIQHFCFFKIEVCRRILFDCTSLSCASQILGFYKFKVCSNLDYSKSMGTIFNSMCSLHVSVPHPGNSCNISNLFSLVFWDRASLCHTGWSAVAQSWLTAVLTSWAQVILLFQPPR